MSQRFDRPELHLCGLCVRRPEPLSPVEAGRLHSRHFDRPVSEITREQMEIKPGDPTGWLDHVEQSILSTGVRWNAGLVAVGGRLEIAEGNHRAWLAHQHHRFLPALIFTPMCGDCTEATFIDMINDQTRAGGWLHHQQGF